MSTSESEGISRWRSRLWLAMLLPLLGLTAALTLGYLWNEDLFWYLGSGHAVIEHSGGFPATDPFLYTADDGIGWVYHSWLWTVIVAALDLLGGLSAVTIFHAVLAGLLVGRIYTTGRVDRLGVVNAVMVLLFIAAAGKRLTGKTEMASWLLLVVFVWIFERHRERFGWRTIAALAVLQVLWANLHGGFPLGIFVALCYCVAPLVESRWRGTWRRGTSESRPPLWLPLLLFAVSLADPRLFAERLAPFGFVLGAESVQPIGESGTMLILEWRSPFDPTVESPRLLWLYFLPLSIALVSFVRHRPISLARFSLLAGFAVLGATAIRHLPVLALVAALVTLANLSDARRDADPSANRNRRPAKGRAPSRHGRRTAIAYSCVATVLALAIVGSAAGLWLARSGFEGGQSAGSWFNVKPSLASPGAADYILDNDLEGPIFNDFQLGAYLGPRLRPAHRVFVDPRVLDPRIVAEYTRILDSKAAWQRAERTHGFRTVVLGHFSTAIAKPLGAALVEDPAWRIVYLDPLATVFVKDQPLLEPAISFFYRPAPALDPRVPYLRPSPLIAPLDLLRRAILDDEPSNYLIAYLGNLGRLGFAEEVENVATIALRSQPDDPLLLRQRCAARFAAREHAAALEDCQRAYELSPDDPQIVAIYAMTLAAVGHRMQASALIDRALERTPSDRALQQLRRQLR